MSFGKQARNIIRNAMEPSEDDIGMVRTVTDCTQEIAIAYLKAKNNNVEQAVTALLDGEDISKPTWDDSVWTADRDLQPLGAPTRGPSPVHKPQQEQGIIGPYNPNDWALVKTTTTIEITPDVSPVDRAGGPRFLKPNDDYLPAFLTICHTIPAVRNILLFPEYTRPYGSNPEWWKGQEIYVPKIVHTDGSPTDSRLARYDDFIAETQRITAFLDGSARAYTTTSILERQNGLKYHVKSKTLPDTFIQELAQASWSITGREDVKDFFTTTAGSAEETNQVTGVLHLDVEGSKTIIELLDNVLWDPEEDEDRYLVRLPAVLTMHLKQVTGNLGVKASGILSLDKYMQDNVDEMRPVRQKMAAAKKRLEKLSEVESKLSTWHVNGRSVDAMELLAQSHAQLQGEPARQLEEVIGSVNQKLLLLQSERQKALEALAELSSSTSQSQEHQFHLVGVATKMGTTYILQRQPEDEQPLLDQGDETPQGMQWWRIEYLISGTTATISRTKVASYDVLGAIEHEHNTALVVYASEEALSTANFPLSDELREFVKQDNEHFEEELRAIPPPAYPFNMDVDVPRQSIERKTSMDSTTAQIDTPDEAPFEDPTQHSNYNLGYGSATVYDDGPVIEIPPPK